jgi:WD40 repeat protein
MTYKAFISYSHAADGKLAPAIQSALESFAKPWYKLRAVRVFRDETTLAMTPKLWPSLETALDESEYFLLLASVESSSSKWVHREVEHWLKGKPVDKLLILVTGSRPLASDDSPIDFSWIRANLLPAQLAKKLPEEEPLYLDLRWARSEDDLSTRNPRFLGEIAGLVAALTGRPKDELIGEDVRQHRKVRRLTWSAASLLVLTTIASVLGALWATWQKDNALARECVATSMLSQEADPAASGLFAAYAVTATWRWNRKVLPEAEAQLHRAILSYRLKRKLDAHNGGVYSVAWSPPQAGKPERVATGGADGKAKLWDPETGEDLLTLGGGNGAVSSVAWSPDGKHLATGSVDGTAKLWDVETGKKLLTLSDHGGGIVAWSPDGKQLAMGNDDGTAKLWDSETGKELVTLGGGDGYAILSVAWSPPLPGEPERLAIGRADENVVEIWNTATGKRLRTLPLPGREVAWSPDGKRLATGSAQGGEGENREAYLWDATTGKELLTMSGHGEAVYRVAWSPDGKRLATGSADGDVSVWDSGSGRELLNLNGHGKPIYSVSWSPDGRQLSTGSQDGTAAIWDVDSGQELLSVGGSSGAVYSVAWSPRVTGKPERLATARDDGSARVCDAETGEELLTLSGHGSWVTGVAWSADGRQLATGSHDNTAKVWDAETGKELQTLRSHKNYSAVTSVAWSPTGRRLATGSSDGTVKVWDAESGKELLTLRGDSDYAQVTSVTWSPDGKRLATGADANTATVWDAETGKELLTMSLHNGFWVTSVAWSPDGRRLVTGSQDSTAKVWDAETGKQLQTLSGLYGVVRSVAWSPDGKRLAMGNDQKTTTVWDAASGQELLTLNGHRGEVYSVAWSPDGKRLAAGSLDGTVAVYAMNIHLLMALARQRITPYLSGEGCKKYLHVDKCPPFPQLSFW